METIWADCEIDYIKISEKELNVLTKICGSVSLEKFLSLGFKKEDYHIVTDIYSGIDNPFKNNQ